MKLCSVSVLLCATIFGIAAADTAYNPCCSSPCQNGGYCMAQSDQTYLCDCTNTGYSGKNCRRASWSTWFANLFRPSPEFAHNLVAGNALLWKIVNRIYSLRCYLMRNVLKVRMGIIDVPPHLSAYSEYPNVDLHKNYSYYSRTLPPIPKNCPTAMGVVGPKVLPPEEEVAERLFKRTKFVRNSLRTNILFPTYAQHFTHMFFKTDVMKGPGYTWGDQNVYMSNIYGKDTKLERKLRSLEGGRLKMQTINGEEYPVYDPDAVLPFRAKEAPKDKPAFLLGHPAFNMLPNLMFLNTIWMREHNRVAGILSREHPHWDDERLFHTSKLIILGQTLKITIEDYVQHLSNYNFRLVFDPTIMYNERVQYFNHIHYEFKLLYHWHPLMPDSIKVNSTEFPMSAWVYNPWEITKYGSHAFLKTMTETAAGEITVHNHGKETYYVVKDLLKQARKLRIQSFNQYRRRFRLEPYKSIHELTGGNEELTAILKDLYQHIDAVELYPGLLAEKRRSNSMFGPTLIEMGSPYSLQGLYGNSFASPQLWRPSTFGGETGFNIVTTATLKKLICNNVPAPCPRISFKTHGENYEAVSEEADSKKNEL